MVWVSVLASGSSGNSFFVKAGEQSFLIDAGITCRQIAERLSILGQNIENINGVFVTHAHSDHISGIDVLTRKFNTPIYTTQPTFDAFSAKIRDKSNIRLIESDKPFWLDDVQINPFSKAHDCADPTSFSITHNSKTASIITDIGHACPNVISAVKNAHVLCLESNHDLHMLENGPYPYFLKKRVAGDKGHLSNHDAALLVLEHASPQLKHVFLSHLSLNNNTPELAESAFRIVKERQDLRDLTYSLTYRHKPTELIKL